MLFADTVYKNGNIITMDPGRPKATSVAIWGDKIVVVGSDAEVAEMAGPTTEVVDLEGKTMTPGLIEGHCHLIHFGNNLRTVNCTPEKTPSIEALKAAIAEKAAKTAPGKWVEGWGYDDSRMAEHRHPTRDDLDEAAPNNPVLITRTDYHMVVCNSKALILAGLTEETPDPAGGRIVRDAKGRMTGLLQETARFRAMEAMPKPSREDVAEMIGMACAGYNKLGFTSATDASTLFDIDGEYAAWSDTLMDGRLTLRMYTLLSEDSARRVRNLGVGSGFGNDMFKIGCVKYFMDGSIGGGTSAMKNGYANDPNNHGILYHVQSEIEAKVMDVHKAGYRISVHAIGDQAVDNILTAFEKAQKAYPRPGCRHRLEHCHICPPDLQKRVKDLGLCIAMQPGFLYYLGASQITFLGEEGIKKEVQIKTMLDQGTEIALSTDNPVINPDPAITLYSAVARKVLDGRSCGTEECITPEQALRCYTMGGAYCTMEEDIKGSIEIGKLADLAVFNLDPTAVKVPEELLGLKALMTVLGGKVIYKA